jgi:hypothetical protein
MIRSFEDLVARLGEPDVDLDGRLIHGTLRRPMVYVWIRTYGEEALIEYVGKSAGGLARAIAADHHRTELGEKGDRLLCWCVDSDAEATALEAELIVCCNPRLNGKHPRRPAVAIARGDKIRRADSP